MANDEVNSSIGGEGAEVKTTTATKKKKLRKWRMPQAQIDLVLSWAPLAAPRPCYREDMAVSEEEKEELRQLDADGVEAVRSMNQYQKEHQDWVKAELAAHGYVECEIDDDDNSCTCGCAYTGHEEDEGEGCGCGEEGDDDYGCDDDDGKDEEDPTEETKEI